MKRSREYVEALIQERLPKLGDWILEGFDEAAKFIKSRASIFSKADKCAIFRAFIWERILRGVESDRPSGVAIRTIKKYKFLDVCGELLLRIKKLSLKGRARNYETLQVQLFNAQSPLFSEEDAPEPLHLNAGYSPDVTWTEALRIMISKPKGKRIEYIIDLSTGASGSGSAPIPFEPPIQTTEKFRKKAEPSKKKEESGDGNDKS
jgi:hypothetical protein